MSILKQKMFKKNESETTSEFVARIDQWFVDHGAERSGFRLTIESYNYNESLSECIVVYFKGE